MADPGKNATESTEESTSKAVPDDVLTAEIVGSGDAYRRLGEILISLLAAIPGAALISTLIAGPGEGRLDESRLGLGLLFVVIAIVLGVLVAFRVRAPVELGKADLNKVDMRSIVGTNQPSYDRLLERIEQVEQQLAGESDEAKRREIARHLEALETSLRRVHLVATAKHLKGRAKDFWTLLPALLALAAAAFAAFNLALAPVDTEDAGVSVVSVELSSEGAAQLGCPTNTFDALKIGGTETEPHVVPLGGVQCEAGTLLQVKVGAEEATAESVEGIDPVREIADPAE